MTREEALAYAISRKVGLESELHRTPCGYGNWAVYSTALDFINAAISALKGPTREQVEKVWRGCKYCDEEGGTCNPITNRCTMPPRGGIRVCPMCGRPLTDEAVEMVMERLEALYEKD